MKPDDTPGYFSRFPFRICRETFLVPVCKLAEFTSGRSSNCIRTSSVNVRLILLYSKQEPQQATMSELKPTAVAILPRVKIQHTELY